MVNTEWDEETVGYSATGDLVFIYFDNAEFYGDVGASMLKGKMWQRPAMMPTNLNSYSLRDHAYSRLSSSAGQLRTVYCGTGHCRLDVRLFCLKQSSPSCGLPGYFLSAISFLFVFDSRCAKRSPRSAAHAVQQQRQDDLLGPAQLSR